ncbi:MAG: alpha-(1-_3)-arabinofuranosyltransferase family protein [Candidatus Moranbacteria bacterium]|jgi:hypothetical protein|nr:alpha-(1->3)-arabinofuranosyltransferase family protein [Candidatus Moranbacteria bacterium]
MKKLNNKLKGVIFPLVVLSGLPFIFFTDESIVQSTIRYFSNDFLNIFDNFFSWSSESFGQNNLSTMWRIFPLDILYFLLNVFLKISPNITQFFILAALFFIGSYSFCLLILEIFETQKINKWAIFTGAVFFLYNPYVLSFLSSSYFMVIPYMFLPLQLFLFMRGIKTGELLRYSIYLALISLVTFGVNLIFDIIAVFLLVCYGLWGVVVTKEIKSSTFFKFGILIVCFSFGLIIWWALPLVAGNLMDSTTVGYNLGSEKFYNNDTTVINVLRNFGDWSFFGQYKGMLYRNFSTIYKVNPLVLASTFVLPLLIFSFLLFLPGFKNTFLRKKILFFYICSLLLLPFVGGTNSTWPTSGAMNWAFENVPFFMAFRNTYKWMSIIVFFYAILLVVLLNYFVSLRTQENKWINFLVNRYAWKVVLAIIFIASFPFWTGKLFEDRIRYTGIPDYWHQMGEYVNSNLDSSKDRILLLPDQYFDVFNWNNTIKTVPDGLANAMFNIPVARNTCVGCGNYNVSLLYDFVYGKLKNKNLDKLLGMLNISHVLQRNDYDWNYYGVQNPEEIKKVIAFYPSFSLVKSFGMLDLYKLKEEFVYPRMYSPGQVSLAETFDESLGVIDQFGGNGEKISFVTKKSEAEKGDFLNDLNYYKNLFRAENTQLENGKMIENFSIFSGDDYTIAKNEEEATNSYELSYIFTAEKCILKFKNIDEKIFAKDERVNQSVIDDFEKEISLDLQSLRKTGVEIEGEVFIIEPTEDWKYLSSIQLSQKDLYQINIYDIEENRSNNSLRNGSFENGFWSNEVGNCNYTMDNARIYMDLIRDASEGDFAVSLTAEDDSACTYSTPIREFEKDRVYYLSFDYKNIEGAAPSFCIWDGKGCGLYKDISSSKEWSRYETLVKTNVEASQFMIYFYAHKDNFSKTSNAYDNVLVNKLGNPYKVVNFSLPYVAGFSKDLYLNEGTNQVTAEVHIGKENLLKDASFEDGLWESQVKNCRMYHREAPLAMNIVSNDATEGNNSLELSAKQDVACTTSSATKMFSKYSSYVVSFDYKIIEGDIARFCVWDGNECIKLEDIKKNEDGWQHYEGVFEPKMDSRELRVYFYASAEKGNNSVVRYDNVRINEIENKVLSVYYVKTKNKKDIASAEVSFDKINSTQYNLKIKQQGSSLIVFQESFHPGWRLFLQKKGFPSGVLDQLKRAIGLWEEKEIATDTHIMVNGFANAWWVEKGDLYNNEGEYEVILEFIPQRWFYLGLLISGTTFVGCIGYLGYALLNKRKIKQSKILSDEERGEGKNF